MKFPGFVGQAYRMGSLPISAQRCVNWYPEKQRDKGASSTYVLQPTPGYGLLIDIIDEALPTGSYTRGIYRTSRGIGVQSSESNGSIIVVTGTGVFWYKSDTKTVELLGEVSNLISRVSFTDDGFGMIIADGSTLHRLDLTSKAFAPIPFDLTNPTSVDFYKGYTLAIGQQQGNPQNTFFWSDQYQNNSWNTFNYASAEESADPITALIVNGGYIWMMGPSSYELWSKTGDADLPFSQSYASSGSIGIIAPQSLTKTGNGVFMIGAENQGSARAYMSNGNQMVPISTLALEQHWQDFDVTDCTAWTYSDRGHDFVVFNFDAMDETWVYDVRDGEWHERASRDQLTDTLHRWEPNYVVQSGTDIIVGDRNSTKLFLMSNDYVTEGEERDENGDVLVYGRNILRIRTTAHQQAEGKVMRIDAVRFDMETGRGITKGDPDGRAYGAPTVMLRESFDRSRIYGSEERQGFGALGEYDTQVEYRRRGAGSFYTIEFKISDPVQTAILNAWIYLTIGTRGRK